MTVRGRSWRFSTVHYGTSRCVTGQAWETVRADASVTTALRGKDKGKGRREMEEELRELAARARASLTTSADYAAYEHLLALVRQNTSTAREELARVLVANGQPLCARETAAFVLGCAGDRRAFEPLVMLLNYRDPAHCATAARALARLGDPRTARAAAVLATNPLRTAYALHPIRLLVELRAPESVPALVTTLRRLLAERDHYWPIARACVVGLGTLGDRRAIPVLAAAREHERLRPEADTALALLAGKTPRPGGAARADGARDDGTRGARDAAWGGGVPGPRDPRDPRDGPGGGGARGVPPGRRDPRPGTRPPGQRPRPNP
ncbi:HEAT repeat domain-containing protein [Streptomyces zagrosensis]|uniref:HEAT repeat protein n=1 Tax=Streptomyces zagrosensis TaxID=1042984 RepID=A0A7W9Q9U0_9ACTN|nr:HEAT repeat domain-containing protein [Streptomyces zagrosensis]MBB5936281.1 HEAT repeat protein [Streptomyces zagrosensis]